NIPRAPSESKAPASRASRPRAFALAQCRDASSGEVLCMIRVLGLALAVTVVLTARADELENSATRVTIGANENLVAGAEAIRAGDFDEGIRLTSIGLEHSD